MKYIKFIGYLIAILVVGVPSVINAKQTPGEIVLRDVVKNLEEMPSIDARFTITERDNSIDGVVVVSGSCFSIVAGDGSYESWFDGKTQWTWTSMTNEVNMTTPSQEELLETNPFAILHTAPDLYNATILNDSLDCIILRLVPKVLKNARIKEAQLKVSKPSNIPLALEVELTDGDKIVFSFSKLTKGKKIPDTDFRYKPSYHPEAEIIDLR